MPKVEYTPAELDKFVYQALSDQLDNANINRSQGEGWQNITVTLHNEAGKVTLVITGQYKMTGLTETEYRNLTAITPSAEDE